MFRKKKSGPIVVVSESVRLIKEVSISNYKNGTYQNKIEEMTNFYVSHVYYYSNDTEYAETYSLRLDDEENANFAFDHLVKNNGQISNKITVKEQKINK
jgi:hypothetical protein